MQRFLRSRPTRAHERVAVGLGSNVPPRFQYLQEAAQALDGFLNGLALSPVYETDPVGIIDQPLFLNACCVAWTDLRPSALLDHLKRLERAAGRVSAGERFGPRELDLDILLYGDEVVNIHDLTIPHPRMVDRAFVLVPFAEIASGWVHPGVNLTIAELVESVDCSGVRATKLRLDNAG